MSLQVQHQACPVGTAQRHLRAKVQRIGEESGLLGPAGRITQATRDATTAGYQGKHYVPPSPLSCIEVSLSHNWQRLCHSHSVLI